jgi:hypothetical protein
MSEGGKSTAFADGPHEGEIMKGLFWLGLILLVLGIASMVVPLPHKEREGVKVGGASIGIETKHDEKVSPIISAVLIAAGAGLMIAGKKKSPVT